jgi:DNA polymerase III alpha subunit
MHVRALSNKALDRIAAERRQGGRFRNLEDFVRRVPLGRREIENLVLVGAFDGFGLTQPESLFLLDDIHKNMSLDEPDLFQAGGADAGRFAQAHPGLTDYTLAHRCFNELRLLGFMLSGNILDILDLHPASRDAVPACRVHEHKGRRIKVFGWMITNRIHMVGAQRPMMFVTVEDKTECVDVILWPDVYEQYADVLADVGPFEIWGKVSEDWGAYTVEAMHIAAVTWSPAVVDFERASKRLEKSFTQDYTYGDIPKTAAA